MKVFDTNIWLQSSATILVGLFAFIVYRLEKTDKERSASSIVLEEIRTIEDNITKLKETKDFLGIIPANLSTSGWYIYRHILVKYMDVDEISEIGSFFERAEVLKDMLDQWRKMFFVAMENKAAVAIQYRAKFYIDSPTKDYEDNIERLKNFEKDNYWFKPNEFEKRIESKLASYGSISTTTVGEKLKRISRKEWYRRK